MVRRTLQRLQEAFVRQPVGTIMLVGPGSEHERVEGSHPAIILVT